MFHTARSVFCVSIYDRCINLNEHGMDLTDDFDDLINSQTFLLNSGNHLNLVKRNKFSIRFVFSLNKTEYKFSVVLRVLTLHNFDHEII